MGKMNNILQRLVATLMLLLFVEHIFSVTVFMHQHTIDGQTFTHSHIFSGTAESPQHTHTQQQINLIAALSAIKIFATAIATLRVMRAAVVSQFIDYIVRKASAPVVRALSLRAPPAVVA